MKFLKNKSHPKMASPRLRGSDLMPTYGLRIKKPLKRGFMSSQESKAALNGVTQS